MLDLATVYATAQASLTDLLRSLTPDELATHVPACPDWTVQDVAAHLTGVLADVVDGTWPRSFVPIDAWRDPAQAVTRDEMTDREVSSRRGRSLDEVLGEWAHYLKRGTPMLRGEEPFGGGAPPLAEYMITTDLHVHDADIRGALDRPVDTASAGVSIGLATYATGVIPRLIGSNLPALLLRYEGKERLIGEGEPAATLSGPRFELFRALAGRRSRDQIAAMDWTGDPTPYLPLIPAYGERTDPLDV